MNTLRQSLTNRHLASCVACGYFILLTYLLLTPEPLFMLGPMGGDVHAAVDSAVSDRLQHGIAYTVLTGLLLWWSRVTGRSSITWCALAAVLHGLSTEILQLFIPQRFGDVLDFMADCAGIAGALVIAAAAPRAIRAMPRAALSANAAQIDA